ncbi:hypothetical protein [Bradyrhizobium sp. BR 10261]|uniref:hypothetical protein n=1 Tax=Bradyrhizobium sp. BR 10261 TaxID=2749992 RepID=UPI001C653045|nr:hypothetical protein [Bradyrhizobium sp. BR 10261]MBW7964153.1 hypothetical protein [Bradyrhizobium sp. BR 10261]
MTKKPLKKESEGPKRQHSRNFREELFEFLDDVKQGIEEGDDWESEFKPHIPDEDSAPGLVEMFERAGLDINKPGHWQFMLVAVVNAYGEYWTRVTTDWTEDDKNRFLRDVVAQRIEGENNRRGLLCERLHNSKPNQYPATGESLRIQLQKILKEKRDCIANGTASAEDVELLKLFDP